MILTVSGEYQLTVAIIYIIKLCKLSSRLNRDRTWIPSSNPNLVLYLFLDVDDKFALQIKALLEYGQYKQGFERVMRYADEIKPNVDLIIELYFCILCSASTFLECHQYEFTLEILKLSDLFNKQFELPRNDLLTLFKLYYVETLSQLEGAHHSLKLTKDIFDDDIRKVILLSPRKFNFKSIKYLRAEGNPFPKTGTAYSSPNLCPSHPRETLEESVSSLGSDLRSCFSSPSVSAWRSQRWLSNLSGIF